MTTILLDSCVIIDVLNNNGGWRRYLSDLLDRGHLLACCAVNLTEVYAGMRDHERVETEQFLNSLEFFPIGLAEATRAGLLRREWRQLGKTLSYTDVSVAAVAICQEMELLTANQKHFPMPELHLRQLPA